MDIFYGIDGTGPGNNDQYAAEFDDSHVRKMWKCWHSPVKEYRRGPTWDGLATTTIMLEGLAWVKKTWKHEQQWATPENPTRIFLAGYSRGGAAVIQLAYHLGKVGIPVHAMFLYDAVDRSLLAEADTIPKNVASCFHALRNAGGESREIFGNCGRSAAPPVRFLEETFLCTHGGIGGTPWMKDGKSGTVEELKTWQKALVVAARGLFGPVAMWETEDRAAKLNTTRIDRDQDLKGADEAWQWMSRNLASARAMNEAERIGVFGSVGAVKE